jgi:UDP-N-acetylglucosamine--N-acetylmuramyl-(pentapeptide) pyrophosphoryl-undecaprenol N-acetylglucosamine transferase
LAGGGTGGHVFPGLAVAEEIRAQDDRSEILFVGAPGGIEEKLVPAAGGNLEVVPSVKVRGPLDYLKLPLVMFKAVRAARRLQDRFRPDVVVAMGGYACCAPALAAWRRGLPVVVLEQNAIPGRVVRFVSRFAVEVHATYEESVSRLPRPTRVRVTGNPVRRAVLDAAENRPARAPGEPLGLLVAGGSQGAKRLNELFAEAARDLEPLAGKLRVVHLAGRAHYEATARAVRDLSLAVEVVDFEEDMASRYARADLVLSRAGAGGLAEMAVFGVPAILVPYPHAKDNHQEANARSFERSGAARVLLEPELDGPKLAVALRGLLEDDEGRAAMAVKMKARGRPRAGEEVAKSVLELARKGGPA